MYLRHFAIGERLYTFRTLVEHANVPLWRLSSVAGVGYHQHLYTRVVSGQDADETERWLAREFDNPAAGPLHRATNDEQMSQEDWRCLARFVSIQMVRTPAYYARQFPVWCQTIRSTFDAHLRDSVDEWESARRRGEFPPHSPYEHGKYFPLRVTKPLNPEDNTGQLQVSTVVGRQYWQFAMRAMDAVRAALCSYRWTILAPAEDMFWFTCDDPVLVMRFQDEGNYSLDGPIVQKGTEIVMPLGPRHLIYTRVGEARLPRRGTVLSRRETEQMRKLIAVHAFRTVFAHAPVKDIELLRPRRVDRELVRSDRHNWRMWHNEQSEAERGLAQRDEQSIPPPSC